MENNNKLTIEITPSQLSNFEGPPWHLSLKDLVL